MGTTYKLETKIKLFDKWYNARCVEIFNSMEKLEETKNTVKKFLSNSNYEHKFIITTTFVEKI